MPDSQKIIDSSSSFGSKALIVNELGAIGSHLADSLLSLGCFLFYFGDKKRDKIDHLLGKSNFEFIKNLDKIYGLSDLNYLFYLSDEQGRSLSEIIKKIKGKNLKLLLVFPGKKKIAKKIGEELQKLGIDARICLFREIYGPRLKDGYFSSILKRAFLGEKVRFYQDETRLIPLVFYSDFVTGLNRAMFAPDTAGRIIDLSGQPVSSLMFLSEIEKVIKKTPEIEFLKKESQVVEEAEEREENFLESSWLPEVNLSEGISKTAAWLEREAREEIQKGREKSFKIFKTPSSKKKKFTFGFSLFLFLVFFFFLFPTFLFWINFTSFNQTLNQAQASWQKGDWKATKDYLKEAQVKILSTKKLYDLAAPFYDLVGFGPTISQIEPILTGGTKYLQSLESFFQATELLVSSLSPLFKGETIDATSSAHQIALFLEKSYFDLSFASGILKDSWNNKQISKLLRIEKTLSQGKDFTQNYKQILSKLRAIVSHLPEIFGNNGKRTYLIVFQNNFEVRPTGGFLGSYGILTFDQGKLAEFEVQDISEADKLLRGQVDPPIQLKNYLGQRNWYLKDANWYPDFKESAGVIEWFFEKETGRTVDGVFAVNLNALKAFLEPAGEIWLENLGLKIDYQNVFEKAVSYSDIGTFPDSSEGPEFLGQLAKAIFGKLVSDKDFPWIKFLKVISSSLSQKDILVFFHNPTIDLLTRSFDWDGSIPESFPCEDFPQNCIEDYFFVNEANLGINRANYFTKRMIEYSVDLKQEGVLRQTLKVNYQNLSLSEAWPAGRYKNYLRILIPQKAVLESVMLNDPADPSYWLQLPSEKIDFASSSGKLSIGALIEIPIRASRTVEVKYSLPFAADLGKTVSYLLFVQKQSGAVETPLNFTFLAPAELKPIRILPKGVVFGGKILVTDELDQDKVFRIDFRRGF